MTGNLENCAHRSSAFPGRAACAKLRSLDQACVNPKPEFRPGPLAKSARLLNIVGSLLDRDLRRRRDAATSPTSRTEGSPQASNRNAHMTRSFTSSFGRAKNGCPCRDRKAALEDVMFPVGGSMGDGLGGSCRRYGISSRYLLVEPGDLRLRHPCGDPH
jgi:hypothetical protein